MRPVPWSGIVLMAVGGLVDLTADSRASRPWLVVELESKMIRKVLVIALLGGAIATPALAAGCIKGAAVGGVGGHFVGKGHAVAGAAIGCAVGHHRAKVQARQQAQAAPPPRK